MRLFSYVFGPAFRRHARHRAQMPIFFAYPPNDAILGNQLPLVVDLPDLIGSNYCKELVITIQKVIT